MTRLLPILLVIAPTLSAHAASTWSDEAFAPKIEPQLLWLERVGGTGDQWFAGVQIKKIASLHEVLVVLAYKLPWTLMTR